MDISEKMRVLVVDGSPLTRFALAALIDLHPLVTVCDEARDVPEARRLCAEAKPDFIILDIQLPRGDGLDLLREFRRLHPPARPLVVSAEEDSGVVHRAFRAGARAYLSKMDEAAELLVAIESVLEGKLYTSRRVSHYLLASLSEGLLEKRQAELKSLSNRELHIFRLLGRKQGATAVARELGLSVKTIETHQGRIKEKLKLRSCEELRRRAVEWTARSQ